MIVHLHSSIPTEIRLLKNKFGEAYEDYKKKAGMLLPKIKKQGD